MATKQQKIFARIVLHNKLLDQAQLEQLLEQMPDPEVIAKYLLKSGKLPEKKVAQLLALYHKQLEKQVKPTKAKTSYTPSETPAVGPYPPWIRRVIWAYIPHWPWTRTTIRWSATSRPQASPAAPSS